MTSCTVQQATPNNLIIQIRISLSPAARRNGKVATTDQRITGSIPSSTVGFFFSGELFHGMYELSASLSFSMFCLRRRPLRSADHSTGEAIQLYPTCDP